MSKKPRGHRITFWMSDEELETIDNWHDANCISTRAEAIRRLCQIGLFCDKEINSIYDRMTNAVIEILKQAEQAPETSPLRHFVENSLQPLLDSYFNTANSVRSCKAQINRLSGSNLVTHVDAKETAAQENEHIRNAVDLINTINSRIEALKAESQLLNR